MTLSGLKNINKQAEPKQTTILWVKKKKLHVRFANLELRVQSGNLCKTRIWKEECIIDLNKIIFSTLLELHLFLDKGMGVVLGDYCLPLAGMK